MSLSAHEQRILADIEDGLSRNDGSPILGGPTWLQLNGTFPRSGPLRRY